MNWQKERLSQKQLTSESLRQWQQTLYLEKLLYLLQCIFLQRQREKRWKPLLDRQCPVLKILQPYIKEQKLTVLLVWPNKLFQHGEFVFTFSESLCYVLLFSCANKNFLFWRLSNDCQIACPVLFSGPPNRKPYNKHLISLLFFVRTLAINRWKKNSVRNF